MFGIGAIAAVYRIIRGPSILDRALATDVLLAIAICALGAEMAINRHTDTLVVHAGARDVRGRRLDLDRAVHGEAGCLMSAAEIAVGLLILVSAFLSMAAGIGIVRFPDVLTRLHAATKPQVLGLATVLLAIVLQVPTWGVLTTVVLVMTFQLLTQPMTAHMLGRSAYRSDHVRRDLLIEDDLGHDIEEHDQEEDAGALIRARTAPRHPLAHDRGHCAAHWPRGQ